MPGVEFRMLSSGNVLDERPSMTAFVTAILLFVIFIFPVFSVSGENKTENWQKFGIKITSENSEVLTDPSAIEAEKKKPPVESLENEGKSESEIVRLADSNGFEFTYKTDLSSPLNDSQIEKLLKLKEQIQSLGFMKIKSMHFRYAERSLDSHVLFDSFVCGTDEYKEKIPAGIFFSLTDSLEYNFRFADDKYFFRISGIFKDEEGICGKIADALGNPLLYLNRSDPTLVVSRVEILDKEIERMSVDNWNLKLSILNLHNRGFFGGSRPINKKSVSRIVSLKKSEPHISDEDLFRRIEKEGLKISRKEFNLVLQVFFQD